MSLGATREDLVEDLLQQSILIGLGIVHSTLPRCHRCPDDRRLGWIELVVAWAGTARLFWQEPSPKKVWR